MRDYPDIDEGSGPQLSPDSPPSELRSLCGGLIRYDGRRRRLWVGGQRLHHGTTGALLASAAIAGALGRRVSLRGGVEWALVGSVLMAHDWPDRTRWFERGAQL